MSTINGDCLKVLKGMADNSIDALVTDPPAGICFMGKDWDSDRGGRDNWIKWLTEVMLECKRVLKPGGHGLVWALPRTSHWTAFALENAGFEVRDVINHIFGSGFPKSKNIGKEVDKLQGNKRVVIGKDRGGSKCNCMAGDFTGGEYNLSKGSSKWEGWGTGLKPATEHWILVRKPIEEPTITKNVLKWRTGGINIDKSRIGTETIIIDGTSNDNNFKGKFKNKVDNPIRTGRFPANLILDDSEVIKKGFPNSKSGNGKAKTYTKEGGHWGKGTQVRNADIGDSGSNARFFYQAKISKAERNQGLNGYITVKYLYNIVNKENILCEDSMEKVVLLKRVISELTKNLSIDVYGENITVRCQKDSLSIIKTELKQITESKILNLLRHLFTKECTQNANLEMVNGGSCVNYAESTKKSTTKNGISVKKDGRSMEDVAHAIYELCVKISKEEQWISESNFHCTVKPKALMSYLIKLITPPNGIVLDPFMGSGSTGVAAYQNGFEFVGIEKEEEYFIIANKRIGYATRKESEEVGDRFAWLK